MSSAWAVHAYGPAGSAIVDLRAANMPPPPSLDEDQRREILSAIGAGEATSINSAAHGAFTAPGRAEAVYVLQQGGPRAADPEAPSGVVLAVFRDGRLAARLDTDSGNTIQDTIDVGGTVELVLRTDTYQMGVATTRLALVSLAGERVNVLASIPDARVDRCGDARFGGDVEASLVRIHHPDTRSKPDIETERYSATCEDGQAPRPEKFRPTSTK